MLGSIHRVATVAVLFHRSANAASFFGGNKTALFNSIHRAAAFSSIMESSDRFLFHQLDSIESTQDEARRLLADFSPEKCLAVTAREQTKGRGTSGRQWVSMSGNVFLTVAVPADKIPTTITLLPLKVGCVVAKVVSQLLKECESSSKVTVKWPNDVLVNQRKIAGVLIESHTAGAATWFLVGIGVNLMNAPSVPTKGPNRGRPSTSVRDNCDSPQTDQEKTPLVAAQIASSLVDWVYESIENPSAKVVEEWKEWAEFGGQQILRDREENEIVVPLGIEPDGQLRVRGQDGRERLLVADYLL